MYVALTMTLVNISIFCYLLIAAKTNSKSSTLKVFYLFKQDSFQSDVSFSSDKFYDWSIFWSTFMSVSSSTPTDILNCHKYPITTILEGLPLLSGLVLYSVQSKLCSLRIFAPIFQNPRDWCPIQFRSVSCAHALNGPLGYHLLPFSLDCLLFLHHHRLLYLFDFLETSFLRFLFST